MVGVPGVKKITLNINDESRVGEAIFRAAYVRPGEWSGFGENFNENDFEARNLV